MYSNLLNESELQASQANHDLDNLVLDFGAGGNRFAISAMAVDRVIGYDQARKRDPNQPWADFHYATNLGELPVIAFNRLAGIQAAGTDRLPTVVILNEQAGAALPRCGLLVHDLHPTVQPAEEIRLGDVPVYLNGSRHLFSATAVLAGRNLPLLRYPLQLN
ncbi:MAG: chemotaxis protein CheW [Wenzhouxiangella sp.]